MNEDPTIETYNIIAESYKSQNQSPFYTDEINIFANIIPARANLLEVGCGTGRDALELIPLCADYTGLDGSTGMLEVAASILPTAKFVVGNFMNLPFDNNSFDACWCASTLLHCKRTNIQTPLSEIHRILQPGGVAFISMREKIETNEEIRPASYASGDRYFAYYSLDEFKEILEKSNFTVLSYHRKPEPFEPEKVWTCYYLRK